MGPTPILFAGVAALAAALLAPAGASAQWNNQPYQFRSNIGGSGPGMSMAYRQAIINEELFGRRPENLVRGADGRLLEIFERDQQAFAADPEPNFRVGGPDRVGIFVGGIGFGAQQTTAGQWTGWVDTARVPDYGGGRRSSTPIDAWVAMLD